MSDQDNKPEKIKLAIGEGDGDTVGEAEMITVTPAPLTEEQINDYCKWLWEKFGSKSPLPRAFVLVLDCEGGPQAFSNIAMPEQKLKTLKPVIKDWLHDKYMNDILADTLREGRKFLESIGAIKKPN